MIQVRIFWFNRRSELKDFTSYKSALDMMKENCHVNFIQQEESTKKYYSKPINQAKW